MNDNHVYDLCYYDKWDEVREFLDSDSNNNKKKRQLVCYQGGNGWTCLHMACCRGAPVDIIKSLLDIGGKDLLMITNSWKSAALHTACYFGASFDVMKMLIDIGGKELVVGKNNDGRTALNLLCCHINDHTKAANKIKLMLQVPGTETILTGKNDFGNTPLDIATAKGASDEIKALLQPRTIKNEPAIATDDNSNLVPADDQDKDTTITDLQAAKQKIADMETQKAEHLKTIADLETEVALLSEQNAQQGKDNTYWKDRVDNLTTICSDRKVELQELKDSTCGSVSNAKKRERADDEDDDDDVASQSRSSKRTRIGPTANEKHSGEDDVDMVMEALLQEKKQSIKFMMQLREVKRERRL